MEWNSIAEDSPVTPQKIRDKIKLKSDNDKGLCRVIPAQINIKNNLKKKLKR